MLVQRFDKVIDLFKTFKTSKNGLLLNKKALKEAKKLKVGDGGLLCSHPCAFAGQPLGQGMLLRHPWSANVSDCSRRSALFSGNERPRGIPPCVLLWLLPTLTL